MRSLLFAFLFAAVTLNAADEQTSSTRVPADEVTLSALREVRAGGVIQLRGHVEVRTESVVIRADEADYDPMTGSLEARGHVQITLETAHPRLKVRDSNPEDLRVFPSYPQK